MIVRLKPSAEAMLALIPEKNREQIIRRVNALADEPRPRGAEKLEGEPLLRVRQGAYRIVYGLADDVVMVVGIYDRKNAYKKKARRGRQ